jgi:hypothetical protein
VPAVLGYRWKVQDSQARQLASDFYAALFTPGGSAYRSLGRALANARHEVFGKYLSHPTWASPILLTKGSHQAEAHAAAMAVR